MTGNMQRLHARYRQEAYDACMLMAAFCDTEELQSQSKFWLALVALIESKYPRTEFSTEFSLSESENG